MQRILFLTERFPPDLGGLATSSARISRTLAGMGLSVDVIVFSRHVESGKLEQESSDCANLRLFRVGMYRQWDMTMPATMNIIDYLHRQTPYALSWGHYLFPAGFLAVWLGRLKKIASVVCARGNDLDKEIFPPGDLARLLWTLQNAGAVSAVSQDMSHKIETLSGRSDITLLANTVETKTFAPQPPSRALRAKLDIKETDLVLGFSGELREKKGTPFLLDALLTAQEHRPTKLLVIGDVRAQQRTALQLFAAEHPQAADQLIVTGHLSEPRLVAEHLQLVDIYLQPSLFEGMPNALLEAMSCGRLCLASDAGGIPEIIRHGENGFLISRAELNHLGIAVIDAIEMPDSQKEAIKAKARATVLENFSYAQEAPALQQVLAPLL